MWTQTSGNKAALVGAVSLQRDHRLPQHAGWVNPAGPSGASESRPSPGAAVVSLSCKAWHSVAVTRTPGVRNSWCATWVGRGREARRAEAVVQWKEVVGGR